MSKEETPVTAPPLSSNDGERPGFEQEQEQKEEWKMSTRGIFVLVTVCVFTLMVAIDSTSIGVALSVSHTI